MSEGAESVRFGYAAFHERPRKRIEPEFVAARLCERGDERFEVVGDGISENGFHFVYRLSDDVLGRSFPSRMDERGEVDVRVAVRKADDGAIRGSEENSRVPPERLFRKEDYRVAVSAVRFGRFAIIKRNRILLRRVRPSNVLERGNFDYVDAVGMFRGIGKKDVPFEEVAVGLDDGTHPFTDESQAFVRIAPDRARRPRYARERRPPVFGSGSQHGFRVSQHTVYTHDTHFRQAGVRK